MSSVPENIKFQNNVHHLSSYQSIENFPEVVSKSCGNILAVVDDLEEVDKMKINRLEKMILTLNNQERHTAAGVMIMITSRIGSEIINQHTLDLARDNLEMRESLKHEDIVNVLHKTSSIPLYQTLLDFSVPVQIIPFLPLTRDHIRSCTKRLYSSKDIVIKYQELQSIVDQVTFFSQDNPIFAKHGCKQVAAKAKSLKPKKQEL